MRLIDTNFAGADLHSADLRGARPEGADLANADLRDADLTDVLIMGSNLTATNIEGSRWQGATLIGDAGAESLLHRPELNPAAISGRDQIQTMALGNVPLNSVAFAPDGRLLATASTDHTTRLWDPATGQHHTTLQGHTGPAEAVTFLPNGALIATVSSDGTTRVWNAASGAFLASLITFSDGGYAVLLADGSYKFEDHPDASSLWWSIKLRRFAPGELDPLLSRNPTTSP